MKATESFSLVLGVALLSTVSVACGAQPPALVVSDGYGNTAMGTGALLHLATGPVDNTAGGYLALVSNTTGSFNTAFGGETLLTNSTGSNNSAFGFDALYSNLTGERNVAFGTYALSNNSTGSQNVAAGAGSLNRNTTGTNNTAMGTDALGLNKTGNYNTSAGVASMYFNTTGGENTANGYAALYRNTTGSYNTANGLDALYNSTTGNYNTAVGHQAMFNNDSGYRNVAIGFNAGYAVSGSDNITIGAQNQGKAAENGVTRIGNKSYQSKAFIAGISGVKTGLAAAKTVFIDANGQLGTIKSSRVYKEDIHPMGSVSERLLALQPVTFRYKEPYDDGSKPVEFGLIAEDVAEVFPELVVNDSEGKPETVRYDLIATLMLNEFEKEHAELAELKKQVAGMAAIIELLERERGTAAARQP